MLTVQESLRYLRECVDLLDEAASLFTTRIQRPVFTQETGGTFRINQHDQSVFFVLRCVRIVSGLRAELCLIEKGFCQEAGVLHRTIQEFAHDLDFVVDGLINTGRRPQMLERVTEYFAERSPTPEDFMSRPKKPRGFLREKVYAATMRLFGGGNPYRIRQVAKTVEDVYAGYVHGNYQHIMEMYNGQGMRFETNGMPQRTLEWLRYVALVVQPILNQFSSIASFFGLEQLMISLRKKSDDLGAHPIYAKSES